MIKLISQIKSWRITESKIIVVVILLVVFAVGGFLVWMLGGSVTNPASTSSSQPTTGNASGSSNVTKLAIKELGVEIALPSSLTGTTYNVVNSDAPKNAPYTVPPTVNLRLGGYSALVSKCLGTTQDGITYPYATISRVSGKAPATSQTVLIQFSSFYIDELASGLSPKCQKDPSLQPMVDSLEKNLHDATKSAFSHAQQI